MRLDRLLPLAAVILLSGIGLLGGIAITGTASASGDRQGRFTMSPAEGGGFVRLDTQTGRMALCQRREGEWSCRDMAEPGRGLEQENDRLRAENKRLQAEIREMEGILLGDKRGDASRDRSGRTPGAELKLPSEQDIENVFNYAQRMLRKFREKWKELEKESKGEPL
jgi:hypothetical protein